MRDDRGAPLTDEQLLDRVAEIGALVVLRGPVEERDFATWRRELRRSAKARQMRLSVRVINELIVVSNPDSVVTDEQRAAAYARITAHLAVQTPVNSKADWAPLGLVGDERTHRSRSVPPA